MRTILFGNQQKHNVINIRGLTTAVGMILCLLTATGLAFGQSDWTTPLKPCWVFENTESSRQNLASDNERVFVITSKGTIIALDQFAGEVRWAADLGGNLATQIIVRGSELLSAALFGSSPEVGTRLVLRKIDPQTGLPFWQHESDSSDGFRGMKTSPGVFVIADQAGTISRLNNDGTVDWRRAFGARITTELIEIDSTLVFGTANKTLVFVDLAAGRIEKQINLKTVAVSLSVSKTGRFFVGDSRGSVFAYEYDNDDPVWKTQTGAGISEFDQFEGDLIVSSKDNFVYRVSSGNGKKIWKRKLAGRILGSSAIDDNHAVFLTSGSSTAIIIDLRNGNLANKYEFDEAFVAGPVRIQDGFAVPTLSKITAITNGTCGK